MAYTKTVWKDRLVQFARRFTKTNETATSVTLMQDPGEVTEAGTPITSTLLNKMEQGIFDAHEDLKSHKENLSPHVLKDGTVQTGLNVDMVDGWHFINAIGQLSLSGNALTNSATMQNIINAMPIPSRAVLAVTSANRASLGLTVSDDGTLTVDKLSTAKTTATLTKHDGTIKTAKISNSNVFSTWEETLSKNNPTATGNFAVENMVKARLFRVIDEISGLERTVLYSFGGDSNGVGVVYGGAGGATILASGESHNLVPTNITAQNEHTYILADSNINIFSNLNGGWENRQELTLSNGGVLFLNGDRFNNLSWINATLQNFWVTYSGRTAGYVRSATGFVHLRGMIANGLTNQNTVLFTLPSGYRPTTMQKILVASWNTGLNYVGLGAINVNPNGEVSIDYVQGSTWVALDNISFSLN